jgi:butyryl-CoA dehydrogenase
VALQDGAAMRELASQISGTIALAREEQLLAEYAAALSTALSDIGNTTQVLIGAMAKDPERALANATIYLDSLGHVVVAWRWLAQGLAAARKGAGMADRDFYAGKLSACRFFFRYELPHITPKLALLRSLDDTALAIPDSGF